MFLRLMLLFKRWRLRKAKEKYEKYQSQLLYHERLSGMEFPTSVAIEILNEHKKTIGLVGKYRAKVKFLEERLEALEHYYEERGNRFPYFLWW